MRLLRTWLVGLGAGVLLAAGLALAGDPAVQYPECNRTATAADLEGAKGAHKAATQFYERADYDRAIQYWKDAYQLDCKAHAVLINIANAYEKKGDRAEAITALETYLARSPDASDAQTIQDKIQNLRNSLRAPTTPTASASGSGAPTTPPVPTASASASADGSARVPIPPPPPPEPPHGYVPWIVAGAAVVPLLAGGVLTSSGVAAISEAEESCPTRKGCAPDIAEQGNQGRTQAAVGGVLLGLGAAGIAGGLIWQLAFNNPPAPARDASPSGPVVRVTPAAGPGMTGVGLTGRF